ncbi:S8 family serine peptidase [Deinococcus sp. AJ005]|uniref:S8 family peptidase n=1 Tax=Deinococcus sp. AJ005 TaxID=2652443 RepID=UPI00125CC9CA|nr:S8 family serine peptidase [Deinococcus sp. AJ005]QFP77300.1 S8 family serine peptidase [Deinococcus sp. AJ005]
MKKDRFIVWRQGGEGQGQVRAGESSALAPRAGANAESVHPPAMTLEVAVLDHRELPDLLQERGVQMAAPSIPMRLIRPVSRAEADASATGPTWGMQAVKADISPQNGKGVTVAILDTGIDPEHPAFAGVNLVRRDFTLAEGDADGGVDAEGHGTHCAGTVFGRDVAGQRIGVAPGVERALIGRVLGADGSGSSEGIARALAWAVQEGAHVVSMSLGMDFPGLVAELIKRGLPAELATSQALLDYRANLNLFGALAAYARSYGGDTTPTLLIAAAGNESRRQQNPDWEVSVAPPATSDGFISVAAVGLGSGNKPDAGLTVAPFSNTGATLSGPGVNVTSAKLGGGLVAYSGTSMATPHVAGVAALWFQSLIDSGDLTRNTIETALKGSATRRPLIAGVDKLDVGLGLVQAPQ